MGARGCRDPLAMVVRLSIVVGWLSLATEAVPVATLPERDLEDESGMKRVAGVTDTLLGTLGFNEDGYDPDNQALNPLFTSSSGASSGMSSGKASIESTESKEEGMGESMKDFSSSSYNSDVGEDQTGQGGKSSLSNPEAAWEDEKFRSAMVTATPIGTFLGFLVGTQLFHLNSQASGLRAALKGNAEEGEDKGGSRSHLQFDPSSARIEAFKATVLEGRYIGAPEPGLPDVRIVDQEIAGLSFIKSVRDDDEFDRLCLGNFIDFGKLNGLDASALAGRVTESWDTCMEGLSTKPVVMAGVEKKMKEVLEENILAARNTLEEAQQNDKLKVVGAEKDIARVASLGKGSITDAQNAKFIKRSLAVLLLNISDFYRMKGTRSYTTFKTALMERISH